MEKISMEEAYTRLKLYLVNDHKVVLSTLWVFIFDEYDLCGYSEYPKTCLSTRIGICR
jgi:hypothetical protein